MRASLPLVGRQQRLPQRQRRAARCPARRRRSSRRRRPGSAASGSRRTSCRALFVADGPLNDSEMYTGLFGAASSSSASVGSRGISPGGTSWLRWKPPIVVIQRAASGCRLARAATISCTSRIEDAFSSGVWYPGRLPISTMWLWLSMMPGTTVRPLQIDDARARRPRHRRAVADRDEAAVPHRHRRRDGVVAVHRVDAAVDEHECLLALAGVAGLVPRRASCRRPALRRDFRGAPSAAAAPAATPAPSSSRRVRPSRWMASGVESSRVRQPLICALQELASPPLHLVDDDLAALHHHLDVQQVVDQIERIAVERSRCRPACRARACRAPCSSR